MNKIEITIELHPNQYIGHNKWKCTIDGQERLVTDQRVRFHADNFENVSRRFNIDECVDVVMRWSRERVSDGRGGSIYHD